MGNSTITKKASASKAKLVSVCSVAVIGVFACATIAMADQVTIAPYNYGPWQTGVGGEFTVTPDAQLAAQLGNYSPWTSNQGGYNGSIQTFCVESLEYLQAGVTYDVTTNSITMMTGDTLTAGAAYLYSQFAQGTLAGYDYANIPGNGRTILGTGNAQTLQNALWFLMEPSLFPSQASNPYVLLADSTLGGYANASAAAGAHNYGVEVINLWTAGSTVHNSQTAWQDLLIYTGVPEPSTLALISAAAGLLALRRRR